jgi:hypothetical protein
VSLQETAAFRRFFAFVGKQEHPKGFCHKIGRFLEDLQQFQI